jgi:uncharacterized protein involved in tolerance to divalent cations
MKKYIQTVISAPSEEEAEKLAAILVKERLVAGCILKNGKTRAWWHGKVTVKQYWNIEGFTTLNRKTQIIKKVEHLSTDDVPIIAFFEIDGNAKFLSWIDSEVS